MKRLNRVFLAFLVLVLAAGGVFLITVMVNALSDKPPGSYDEIKTLNKKFAVRDENIFEDIVSASDRAVNKEGVYTLGEADAWLKSDGTVESVDLYYYAENEKFMQLKVHCDLPKEKKGRLKYVEYYRYAEKGYSEALEPSLIRECLDEVNEKFVKNNPNDVFHVSTYGNGNMYVMTADSSDDDGYSSVVRCDRKTDSRWEIDYNRNTGVGRLTWPFPERN